MSDEADLAALVDKYERMTALRARLGRGAPNDADREVLRALAADFPGALRELEVVDTTELERRLGAARDAVNGGARPEWLRWTAAYHALMKRALAMRAGAQEADEDFAAAVKAPGHGRLNVVVFAAMEKKFGVPATTIWDVVFPRRGRAQRRYRE